MDGEGAIGAADGDVHVETEHELARQHPRELGDQVRVLGVVDHGGLGVGERVRAGAGEPRPAGDAGGERAAGAVELVGRLGDRGADGRGGLELGGEELGAHGNDVAELGAHPRRLGEQVERVGIEQHQLLLDADRVVGHAVEQRPPAVCAQTLRHARDATRDCGLQLTGSVRTAMRIVVFPGVLRPPSDAALLGGVMARDGSGLRGREVLDLCSGTGILGLTAARLGARATAVDLSRRAVLNARLNARLNRLELTALRGDLFEPVEGRRFDLIVSNPPYIPAPPGEEPRGAARAWDAGPDGRAFLDRICDRAAAHLRSGGRILLVHSSLAAPEESERRLAEAGLATRIAAEHNGDLGPVARDRADYLCSIGAADRSGSERMVVVEGRRS